MGRGHGQGWDIVRPWVGLALGHRWACTAVSVVDTASALWRRARGMGLRGGAMQWALGYRQALRPVWYGRRGGQ
jgi:hypothetical protein